MMSKVRFGCARTCKQCPRLASTIFCVACMPLAHIHKFVADNLASKCVVSLKLGIVLGSTANMSCMVLTTVIC